ncbi:microtubule-associated protein 1A-like [Sardina pilchardus]|uniref:microtubule-associated protein 1A-like n=1 Tax=Sardina pilchardus TaxID=27697 RepID=UPI002E0EC992
MKDLQIKDGENNLKEKMQLLEENKTTLMKMEKMLEDKKREVEKMLKQLEQKHKEVEKMTQQLEEKNKGMERMNQQLDEKNKLLHQRDTELGNMTRQEREKESLLENMTSELETSRTQLESLEKDLQDRNSQLQDLRTQLQEHERELEERTKQLEERDKQMEERDTQLEERDKQLEARSKKLEEEERESQHLTGTGRQNFFSKHKHDLQTRLPSVLAPILASLHQKHVINDCERQDLGNITISVNQNYKLLNMIENKGARAQELFYEALKKADPFLVEELEGPHAFLLVIPVESSEGEERRMLEKMKDMFGEGCWGYTLILFTHAEGLRERSVEELLQTGSQELQQLMQRDKTFIA